jgi:plastocyanin
MRKVIALAVFAGAFMVAGVAQAATWQVAAGEQTRAPAGTPKGTTLNAFYPSKLVINAGDSVTFASASFHTVTYPAGKPMPKLIVPDPAKGSYDALNDAAGTPFYFGGLPKLIYNGAAFVPVGGKSIVAGVPASSGILSPPTEKSPPAKATYAFPKAGVFQLLCGVHPGMKVAVTVKPAGTPVPLTATQVTAKAITDQAAAWAKSKALVAQPVPKNTIYMGVGSAPTTLAFVPAKVTVKAGTAVRFINKSGTEPHDAAFGPVKYISNLSKTTDLFPQGPKSKNQAAPFYPYGSEPKGGYSYDGTNHGNGFLATPLTIGSVSSFFTLPHASTVTFAKPGTYKFICFFHGDEMKGTVVVTP